MFDGIKDIGKLMKQAKEMKSKMKEVQSQLKTVQVEGFDRSKRVKVVLTGELECVDVSIDDALLSGGKENLENLLKQAFNDAAEKSKKLATSKLSDISGGLNIPGLT